MRGRSGLLLCLGAAGAAFAWQAWLIPWLADTLQPALEAFALPVVQSISVLCLGGLLFAVLRRFFSDPDEVEIGQRLRRHQQELHALTGRLIDLQENERRSLSRELHDDIGQAISAIKLCATSISGEDKASRGEIVDEIVVIADQTIAKLRDLSMLLRPPQLDALGLEAALRWQSERLFRAGQPALELVLATLPQRPDPAVELACFRIAQEALTNIVRHAGATQVTLTLALHADELRLSVIDDGRGFDPAHIAGLGLVTMRERAQLLGGHFDIETVPDAGTCVRASLPLQPRPQV